MKVSTKIYMLIAKKCVEFIYKNIDKPKEEWNIEELINSQELQEYRIVYEFLLNEHVIKKTHIYASSIVIKNLENPKSIGMSLASKGCSVYVINKLKSL
jgi:hypothetical protein